MSQNQTLSMANNDTDNKHFMQELQFREVSIKDQSVTNFDHRQTPQQLKQTAVLFLNNYAKLDQTFPINTLKESGELKVKQYKESTYYGEIHNGKKNGLGIMVYKNTRIYQGQWANDLKKGFGAQKFPNQCFYKGEYLNGKPNGTGCYTWPNGQYYDGQWANGFKHGSGMWRGQKGDSYKGQWKFGKPEGYGVHTWANGDTYEGEFKQCLKHGEGIQRFSNGDMYKGSYINGKPSGYGQYYWLNGSYFKGNFINGLRDGKGNWKKGVGNSDRYEGNYRNDKKWGYGVFTWASGNIYKGHYQADMRNGLGQMYWVDGSYYRGQWSNGIQNGQGQIYIPTQGFKKGIFQHNKINEVWEQKLINKQSTLKSQVRKRRLTEQQQKSYKKGKKEQSNKLFDSKNIKSDSKNYLIKQKYRIRQKSQGQQRFRNRSQKQVNDYFTAKGSINYSKPHNNQNKLKSADRQKMNLSSNLKPLKTNAEVMSAKNSHSRERLLHSSFYLYKLNMRHNTETYKNLRRQQGNGTKLGLLFKGKLLPQDL